MPPKKKQATSSSSKKQTPETSSSQAADAATLVARVKRADLEALVVRHVETGDRLTLSTLEALLPEAARQAGLLVRKTTVTDGETRTGTGRFDDLDDYCLKMIVSRLPFSCRLTVATSVCKAWRSLRTDAELWRHLGPLRPYQYLHGSGGAVAVNGDGLVRLLRWHPSLAEVRGLDLDAGDKSSKVSPDVVKLCLKQLPNLTTLELSGKKVTAACLKAVPPLGQLKKLKMCDHAYHDEEVKALLRTTPQLEELTQPPNSDLLMTANALRHARLGGEPLVRILELTGGYGSLSRAELRDVGSNFPELHRLHISELRGYGASPDTPDLAPMARLVHLSINKLCTFSNHITTDSLRNVISKLVAACPALETLTLRHGVHHITGTERKAGKRQDPFPHADGSLLDLPSTLRSLTLSDIWLEPSDFDPLLLPQLAHVKIKNGGPSASSVAAALVQNCGKLTQACCTVDTTVGSYWG